MCQTLTPQPAPGPRATVSLCLHCDRQLSQATCFAGPQRRAPPFRARTRPPALGANRPAGPMRRRVSERRAEHILCVMRFLCCRRIGVQEYSCSVEAKVHTAPAPGPAPRPPATNCVLVLEVIPPGSSAAIAPGAGPRRGAARRRNPAPEQSVRDEMSLLPKYKCTRIGVGPGAGPRRRGPWLLDQMAFMSFMAPQLCRAPPPAKVFHGPRRGLGGAGDPAPAPAWPRACGLALLSGWWTRHSAAQHRRHRLRREGLQPKKCVLASTFGSQGISSRTDCVWCGVPPGVAAEPGRVAAVRRQCGAGARRRAAAPGTRHIHPTKEPMKGAMIRPCNHEGSHVNAGRNSKLGRMDAHATLSL